MEPNQNAREGGEGGPREDEGQQAQSDAWGARCTAKNNKNGSAVSHPPYLPPTACRKAKILKEDGGAATLFQGQNSWAV